MVLLSRIARLRAFRLRAFRIPAFCVQALCTHAQQIAIALTAITAILFTTLFAAVPFAHADVLFEGYSKVLLSGEHVGYTVVRYEFDSKKQEFTVVSLLRTNAKGGNLTESIKARASSSLKPIAFQYTGLVGGKAKTIDATFAGDQMTANVHEDGKTNVVKKKLPKGTFLSSFLAYLMLQGKEGIKPGTHYGYQAIAEEDASVNSGEASIEKEEVVDGISTFRVLNNFKGTKFVSNVTAKGEVISTHSPVEQIQTELVVNTQDAITGTTFNPNNVKTLFGSVPKGEENALFRKIGAASSKGAATSSAGAGVSGDPGKASGGASGASTAGTQLGATDADDLDGAGDASEKQKTLQAHKAKAATTDAKKSGVPAGAGVTVKPKSENP